MKEYSRDQENSTAWVEGQKTLIALTENEDKELIPRRGISSLFFSANPYFPDLTTFFFLRLAK